MKKINFIFIFMPNGYVDFEKGKKDSTKILLYSFLLSEKNVWKNGGDSFSFFFNHYTAIHTKKFIDD